MLSKVPKGLFSALVDLNIKKTYNVIIVIDYHPHHGIPQRIQVGRPAYPQQVLSRFAFVVSFLPVNPLDFHLL